MAESESVYVYTFEGNQAMIKRSKEHFHLLGKNNISIIEGNINHTLPLFLQSTTKIDFVLIDANHRYESTIQYFEWLSYHISTNGIIVLDDIYYSAEMSRAWNELKEHPKVYGSVDLFRCGLLFFNSHLGKQHFVWAC